MADRVLYLNDFTIADTTDIGADWDAGYTGHNNLQVVSNKLQSTVVTANNTETVNTLVTPAGLPCWASCLVATIQGAVPVYAGVSLRFSTPGSVSGYTFYAAKGSSECSAIYRWDPGTEVLLVNENATVWGPGDVLRGEITFEGANQRLKLYRNGAELLSVLDNTYLSGRYGATIYTQTTKADVEIDHVQLGDMTLGILCGDDDGDSFQIRQAA